MPKLKKDDISSMVLPDRGTKVLWDSSVPGFGIRASAGGTKSFILKYRTRDEGIVRWLKIGRAHEQNKAGDLTLDEARAEAIKLRGEIAKGGDPAGEKSAARKAMTVGDLCDAFLSHSESRARPLRPNTISSHRSNIENHIRPFLGNRSVKAITSDDITKLQQSIAAGKTAKRKPGRGGVASGGEGAAARCIAVIGAVFEYGRRDLRVVESNPVADIRKLPAKDGRDRVLSSDEIRRLGAAMRDALADGESQTGIAAVRFLLMSGFRRSEALSLKPDYLDVEGQCARLPITKTGKQVRALGVSTLTALDHNLFSAEWCFPAARGDGHFVGLPKVLQNLFSRAQIYKASAHDLRRTFATVAVELGFSELVIASLLGHKMPGVTARYARSPDKILLSAADSVSERIASLLNGVSPDIPA